MEGKRGDVIIKSSLGFIRERLADVFSGLVFWLPIGILVLVGSYFFSSLEDFGQKFLSFFLSDEAVYPGLGIALWIVVFLLTGILLKTTRVADFLSGIPIFGILFRKKGGRIMSVGKLMTMTPCLFLYSPTCPSYGWIISEENVTVDGEDKDYKLLNIYYPNVPSIMTGQIFPVRKESVIKLGNTSREVIDLLLYALRSPDSLRYLPWPDESESEFRRRAWLFGLNIEEPQPK
ncbi:MAG: hypothetical protein PVG61_07190 [Dehalococcoidia bacterium]|jgi:uncharacterized membrane protein